MIRLFIAFPLPIKVRESLADSIGCLRKYGRGVKWVDVETIHITARFLGDTNPSLTEPLGQLIDTVAVQFTPITTLLTTLGGFPNLKRPRVIWAGLDEQAQVLSEIAEKIETGVQHLGFAEEPKQFKPHITLGRIKNPKEISELLNQIEQQELKSLTVLFDRLQLVQSTLTPRGPVYKVLHEAVMADRFAYRTLRSQI